VSNGSVELFPETNPSRLQKQKSARISLDYGLRLNSLRILQVHNRYRQGWGGEDTVADVEFAMLTRRGHQVDRLLVSTSELDGAGPVRLLRAGLGNIWSSRGYREMGDAIARFQPEIIHVHNTFPLLSPSIYWAAHNAGVPVVQTLHNFRLICANAILLRNDTPCEDCVGNLGLSALRHRCYQGSVASTLALVSSAAFHRWANTFTTKVQAFIALNEFSKSIFVRGGLPEDKIFVKPNFTYAAAVHKEPRRSQFVFVGEISVQKGVALLLDAWAEAAPDEARLLMIGYALSRRYSSLRNVTWCGRQSREQVIETVAISRFLILPSLCYENCPMAVLEAFSVGTPVIVPDRGAFPCLMKHEREGIAFSAGDRTSLAQAILKACDQDSSSWNAFSGNALQAYKQQFGAEQSYRQLMTIYEHSMSSFTGAPSHRVIERPSKPSTRPAAALEEQA
jgi:glycosyltransferase involved in cell wall biosynthesis